MNPKPSGENSKLTNSSTDTSLQQSSSQFFYFLRLMQLFPETHPATLHTVLCLCKNDFFCAVDKLLYARRCKSVLKRNQAAGIKRHPFCKGHSYYCYTNESGKGIKRSWDADQVNQNNQQTTQVHETLTTTSTNKEVLDLTVKHEDEKTPASKRSGEETHEPVTVTKSPVPAHIPQLE